MSEWIDLKRYKGFYQISKSLLQIKRVNGKVLKPSINGKGYYTVKLSKNGFGKSYTVHRLLALHFVKGRTKEKNEVNHKNGIKTDIQISNLEWGTHSHNQKHAWSEGLKKRKYIVNPLPPKNNLISKIIKSGNAREIQLTNLRTLEKYIFKSISEASNKTGVGKSSIQNALSGISKTTAGYICQYL